MLAVNRRTTLVSDTLRRLARRGARAKITNLLRKTRPEDVAEVLPTLTPDHQGFVFDILAEDYPEAAGEVLVEAEPALRLSLLAGLTPKRIAGLLSLQAVDDQVFLIEALPEDRRREVLELVNLAARDTVQTHLTYGDDSAGRIMDLQFYALSEDKTISEAIASLQESRDLENIFYLYVVDEAGHLTGVTSLRQLLLSPPARQLSEVMTRSLIKVHIETDQEEVAELATRYNLLAVPVVDDDNKLVGIVTVDDIIDVVQEEANEDFYKMVGTTEDEIIYQDRSFKVAGIRLPWLLVNMLGGLGAALLLSRFETSVGSVVYLTLFAFLPVVMGMAGNIGSQTSTISVRGLATGRVSLASGQVRRFLWQQFKVGVILAVSCAAIVGLAAYFLKASPFHGLVVGVSMFVAILLASLTGVLIPILFSRLGVDPAVAAGPLVATSNDITGILIFFSLALLLSRLLA
ncbi:MAG: magnesium transporter [Acidobacteriota bacterium]|nr:magnesium transporter [Acidobacteriota bacterium]